MRALPFSPLTYHGFDERIAELAAQAANRLSFTQRYSDPYGHAMRAAVDAAMLRHELIEASGARASVEIAAERERRTA